tara:strand:- start:1050 stop:1649 length:600 start_codon:yes stop_codon:yes gene_type:complete
MAKPESSKKTKVPPLVMQHAECGLLVIGDQKQEPKTSGELRVRDVGLHAAQSQGIRLFKDGGFEIRSSENADPQNVKSGSLINQVCKDAPLAIRSEGSMIIEADGTLTIRADKIVMEGKNGDQTSIQLMAKHDVNIKAKNNFIVTAENITHDAKERILTHSEGWNILVAQAVRVHETVSKTEPMAMKAYIKTQTQALKG